jgi:hypothetical protein
MGTQSVADILVDTEEKRGNRDVAWSLRVRLSPPKKWLSQFPPPHWS